MARRFCAISFACVMLLLCFLLCSCEDSDDFYLGNGKDKNSVRDEIFDENTNEDTDTNEESNTQTQLPSDAPERVYFTESGTVWHTRRDCSHIRKSALVIEGTLSEAFDKGKTKQCSSCLSADEKDNNDNTAENGDGSAVDELKNVFWLKGGSVWHKSQECSYLSDDAELQSGSVDEARAAGIENPCSRCAKDTK